MYDILSRFSLRGRRYGLPILLRRKRRQTRGTMTELKRKPILIPIDHGYGNVKTPNFIFPTGITEYKEEPAMATDTLRWAGRWYAIGDNHKEFIADKTADEDYLKLTMAAIAKELNRRGLTEAPVYLAVGLPLTWVGQQKDSFIRYLTQVRNLEYTFNGKDYDVEIITQNVDNLHERAGSSKVCHLHGELMKVCSSRDPNNPHFIETLTPDHCEVKIGDKAKDGSQLRPFIVWFGEAVPNIEKAAELCQKADIFLIIGTSLNVYPAAGLIHYVPEGCPIYLIDPKPVQWNSMLPVHHIMKGASEGMKEFIQCIMHNS